MCVGSNFNGKNKAVAGKNYGITGVYRGSIRSDSVI